MLRRDFLKGSLAGLAASALLPVLNKDTYGADDPELSDSVLWLHGSPYLGHSDFRRDFRGLTPDKARLEIVHFRTDEPWRRKILFRI